MCTMYMMVVFYRANIAVGAHVTNPNTTRKLLVAQFVIYGDLYLNLDNMMFYDGLVAENTMWYWGKLLLWEW